MIGGVNFTLQFVQLEGKTYAYMEVCLECAGSVKSTSKH